MIWRIYIYILHRRLMVQESRLCQPDLLPYLIVSLYIYIYILLWSIVFSKSTVSAAQKLAKRHMDQGPRLKTCWDFGSCLKGWALAGCSEFCNWGDLKSVEWCFLRWEQIVTITQEDLLSFTHTVLRCMICQCLWFLAASVASVKTLWQNLDTNFQHGGA